MIFCSLFHSSSSGQWLGRRHQGSKAWVKTKRETGNERWSGEQTSLAIEGWTVVRWTPNHCPWLIMRTASTIFAFLGEIRSMTGKLQTKQTITYLFQVKFHHKRIPPLCFRCLLSSSPLPSPSSSEVAGKIIIKFLPSPWSPYRPPRRPRRLASHPHSLPLSPYTRHISSWRPMSSLLPSQSRFGPNVFFSKFNHTQWA